MRIFERGDAMRMFRVGLSAAVLAASIVSSAWAQVSDVTPPQLLEFSFTPASIDVTASPQTVTAILRVTDDISGVRYVFVDFRSPSGKQQFFGAGLVSGDQFDGVYQGTLEMPQFVESGVWTARILLQDSLNVATLLPATLQGLGFPTELTVISNPDTNPPVAASLNANPSAADVSSGDVPVTVTVRLTDDVSGIQFRRGADIVISLQSPSGNQRQYLSGSQLSLISGDFFDGIWQGVKVMPRFSESGTWTGRVEISDRAGNFSFGVMVPLLNIASTPSDTTPPVPTGLQFSPLFVNTSAGPQTVHVALAVTDDLAGFDLSAPTPDFNFGTPLFFTSPSGGQGAGTFNLQLSSGSPNSGTWTGTIQLGQFSEQGTWTVDRLRLTDRTRNVRTYDAITLAAMGFPTQIVVVRPSMAPDGSVDASGGLIQDEVFGSAASVLIPPGAVAQTTVVAIDVFESPLDIPTPNGFLGLGTNFVNISLNPAPTSPFPSPGATLVLPLPVALPPGFVMPLYYVDPASGSLQPMLNDSGTPVMGTVDADGHTAIFSGISHFSTVVGLVPETVQVQIDVKPGDAKKTLNLTSQGGLPIAILSSASFDATTVDSATIDVEGARIQLRGNGVPMTSRNDVNGDGLLDLLVHVSTNMLTISEGQGVVTLTASTFGGTAISGRDSIRVVP